MWWQRKHEPESLHFGKTLGFSMDRHDVRFECHCATSDARQPIYLQRLIENSREDSHIA